MTADARMTVEAFNALIVVVSKRRLGPAEQFDRANRAMQVLEEHDAAQRAEVDCLRAAAKLVLPADLNAEPGPYVHVRKEDLACLRTAASGGEVNLGSGGRPVHPYLQAKVCALLSEYRHDLRIERLTATGERLRLCDDALAQLEALLEDTT